MVASACIGQALSPVPPLVRPDVGPADDDIDHVAVLNVLRRLERNKEYLGAYKVPMAIAMQLDQVLPKGGLLDFLTKYPCFFDVTIIGVKSK